MSFDIVTEDNAEMVAMQAYDNPQCLSVNEFYEDYQGFLYVQRLCRRYVKSKRLNERLAINRLTMLMNVFGTPTTIRLLFLKCPPKLWKILKTFLVYKDLVPDVIVGVNGVDIYTETIPIDMTLLERLQTL